VPPGQAKEVAHASTTSIFSRAAWDLGDTGCCHFVSGSARLVVSGSARSVPDNGERVKT
jgi:hypothetical protein